MSSKILAACLGVAVIGSVGCTGEFVSRHIYDRDISQYKGYNEALERDNAEMRPKADAYDQLRKDMDLANGADKTYADLAESLKKALEGLNVAPEVVTINRATGGIVLGDELLSFDSGKFEVTKQGKEIIKRLAEMHRNATFKIVGHTDRKPIVKADTKAKLITDSNDELSVLRAVAVMGVLMQNHIPSGHFLLEGHGSREPLAGGDKSCRRVEIFVMGDSAPVESPKTVKTSAPKTSKK
jgi:flagellar motor protein MotB